MEFFNQTKGYNIYFKHGKDHAKFLLDEAASLSDPSIQNMEKQWSRCLDDPSYLVAFVKFETDYGFSSDSYPMACFRTDLKVGDRVFVTNVDPTAKIGVIESFSFLNWACSWTVLCKENEATITRDKCFILVSLTREAPDMDPLRPLPTAKVLKFFGFKRVKTKSSTFTLALMMENYTSRLFVLFRKNGVDYQLRDLEDEYYSPGEPISVYMDEWPFARNWLAHSGENLYWRTIKMAIAFINNEDLTEFMKPIGSKDKTLYPPQLDEVEETIVNF